MNYEYILKLNTNERGVLIAALNDYLKEIKSFKLNEVLDGLIETTEGILKELKNMDPTTQEEE